MKKPQGNQQVLVWRDGKLCWRIRQVYHDYTRKSWYNFWNPVIDVTYGEPKYIEIPEDNTNG